MSSKIIVLDRSKLCNKKMLKLTQRSLLCLLLFNLIWFGISYATDSPSSHTDGKIYHIEGAKLIFAHVMYRHGDRMLISPYPTDPWKDPKLWPTGFGQLTNIGKQQHYELGQWLRKRYDSVLLSQKYTKDEIYIQSTDVDRTLMSALANLAGLYPPTKTEVWNNNIKWQPIPVHTIPEELDPVLAAKAPCPAWEYELSQLIKSDEFQKIYEKYAYLFNYLSTYSGQKMRTVEDVMRLNNTLFIEALYNRTLPEWTHKVYPSDDMTYISGLQFAVHTYTRKMARLATGPLIKEMLERFEEKLIGQLSPDRRVWVYSAHDTTVANVLNTLKVFDIHSPPYTSCILFELYLDSKSNPYVQFFYKNTSMEPQAMSLPGCGTFCPLKQMYTLYADILPQDHAAECKLSPLDMTYEEANMGMAMGVLATIIGALMLLSVLLLCYFRRFGMRSSYTTYSEVA